MGPVLLSAVKALAEARIAFGIHFVGTEGDGLVGWVITITESLTNDQLKVATELGAMLEKGGIIHLIGRGFE